MLYDKNEAKFHSKSINPFYDNEGSELFLTLNTSNEIPA